ncbi:hypothetical protein VTO42DRAFT_7187 [Malbranchea cinnamomea]
MAHTTSKASHPKHYHNWLHDPGFGDHNAVVIQEVVVYNEVPQRFGKTGVFIGIPLWMRDAHGSKGEGHRSIH